MIFALPLAALVIAGCGGGGGDESTEATATPTATTAALSRAELIEQGDAICAEVNAAAGSDEASGGQTGSPAATLAGLYGGMVSSLNNLGAPRESAGYAEFSSAAEELAKVEDEVKLAAEREEAAALEAAEPNASTALSEFQEAASEYGFEDCAEGPSAPASSASPAEAGELGSEAEVEAVEPEAVEPEPEAAPAPEVAPEGGGAGAVEGGGTGGGTEGGGGTTGGGSGGIGPG